MAKDVANVHQKQLKRLKEKVNNSYQYFRDNYNRYNDSRHFTFVTSMTDADLGLNKTLQRPSIEFNVTEAYLSRLLGEFAKHEPAIEVSAKEGKRIDPAVIRVIEDHLRYIITESNKQGFRYNIYRDTLSGGFSAAKVYTDYVSEKSFHQDIYIRRTFDPTMVGFDPLAWNDDKQDGNYCFECYPMRKEDFEDEYPQFKIQDLKYTRTLGEFQWSYQTETDKILIVCDFYEKKKKKVKIIMLSDGSVQTEKEYKDFIEKWEAEGIIAQAPIPVGKPRTTEITTICRYRLIENQVLEYSETDYDNLPFIFFDGNSILAKDADNYSVKQMTRPYIYNAQGAQRLKNYAGQSLANWLENQIQHKFKVPKDGIPPEYKDAYVNVQQASILVYNAFKDDDPNIPLPAPEIIANPPMPPEIVGTFTQCDMLIQNILGNFDASTAKLASDDISGKAIIESSSLSNAAAMPYVVNYLKGLQAVANNILCLIPKIYVTPRTIPVLTADGKKSYVMINQEGGIKFDYDKDALQVKVEAGVSFSVQQEKAIAQMTALMHTSPLIAEFFATEGAQLIMDNAHFKGSERAMEMFERFMQRKEQEKQQAQQMAMQQNPAMMKAQVDMQKNQQDAQLKQQDLAIKHADAELRHQATVAKAQAEVMKAQTEAEIEMMKFHHQRQMDIATHHRESSKKNKEE